MIKKMLPIIFCIPVICSASDEFTVQSDKLEINFKNNTASLLDNVKINGYNTHIIADKVDIEFIESLKFENIKTAQISTTKGYIKASFKKYKLECKQILWEPKEHRITILNATVDDGINQLIGEKIIYNIKDETFAVISNNANNRVKITVQENDH